jgi:hypothetical protein
MGFAGNQGCRRGDETDGADKTEKQRTPRIQHRILRLGAPRRKFKTEYLLQIWQLSAPRFSR